MAAIGWIKIAAGLSAIAYSWYRAQHHAQVQLQTPNASTGFMRLSSDVLAHILSFLPTQDYCRAIRLCRILTRVSTAPYLVDVRPLHRVERDFLASIIKRSNLRRGLLRSKWLPKQLHIWDAQLPLLKPKSFARNVTHLLIEKIVPNHFADAFQRGLFEHQRLQSVTFLRGEINQQDLVALLSCERLTQLSLIYVKVPLQLLKWSDRLPLALMPADHVRKASRRDRFRWKNQCRYARDYKPDSDSECSASSSEDDSLCSSLSDDDDANKSDTIYAQSKTNIYILPRKAIENLEDGKNQQDGVESKSSSSDDN